MTNLWNQISEIADFDKVLRSTFTFANPFSLFSYLLSRSLNHFHPLISTFTFSDPIFSFLHKLSLSSIPFHALAQTFTFSSNCFFSSRTVKSTQRSLWGEWRPLARAKSIIILQNFAPTSNMDPFLLHSCKYPKYQVLAALRYADLPEAFKFFIEAQFRTIDVDGDGSIGQ